MHPTELKPVDVRIIAATNRDLEEEVAAKRFRRDLYYRLKGALIALPPLRQRREEIPYLVSHALESWCRRQEVALPAVMQVAMEALINCDWPGNVRELIYEIERAASEAGGQAIASKHLSIRSAPAREIAESLSEEEEVERIVATLRATGGNRSEAARQLGINRVTLYRKMRRLGIEFSGAGDAQGAAITD